MKKIGVVGTSGRVHDLANKSSERIFTEVGGNTGNLIFQYAVSKLIAEPKLYFNWQSDTDEINRECRVLVLPCANQLGVHTNYFQRANFLRKIDIPIIALGLGAQSHVATDASANLLATKINKGTKDWLSEISERSDKILLRGPYTEKVCRLIGVENVESFGCPSNLISIYKNLGSRFENLINNIRPNKLVINGGFYSIGKNNYANIVRVEKKIIAEQDYSCLSVVCQAPQDVLEYSFGKVASLDRLQDVFENITSYPRIESFYDVDSWVHFLRGYDWSVGTRIHGAMLSMQSLHPTLLITHDSRTIELADMMHMPQISIETALSCNNVESMIEKIDFNSRNYDECRSKMANTVCELFDMQNVRVSSHIKNLCSVS